MGKNITTVGDSAFAYLFRLTKLNYNAINMSLEKSSNRNLLFASAGSNSSGVTLTIGNEVAKINAGIFSGINGGGGILTGQPNLVGTLYIPDNVSGWGGPIKIKSNGRNYNIWRSLVVAFSEYWSRKLGNNK